MENSSTSDNASFLPLLFLGLDWTAFLAPVPADAAVRLYFFNVLVDIINNLQPLFVEPACQ